MSSPTHVRVFIVVLCLVSFASVTESLLVRDVFDQTTVETRCRGGKPPKPTSFPKEASVEVDEYASVLLRAIIDAPHSWELIIRGPLYWLALWTVIGVTIVLQKIDRTGPETSIKDRVLPCFDLHILSVVMLRVQLAVQARTVSLIPAKIIPLIASPSRLSTSGRRHSQGHGRSASRVAAIEF